MQDHIHTYVRDYILCRSSFKLSVPIVINRTLQKPEMSHQVIVCTWKNHMSPLYI